MVAPAGRTGLDVHRSVVGRPGTWIALCAYAATVVVLTWPLALRAPTDIAATHGRFHSDTLHLAWILAHESRALTETSTTMLDTATYHPERRTLFYSTTAFGLLPYFAPTFLATGNPALAIDVAFLVCVALTAWTIHLVAWRWTHDHLAGVFAAATCLSAGTLTVGFPSAAPCFAALQYTPLIVFAAATPSSRLAAPLVLGTLIALQCLVEPLYIAPAVLVPLAAIVAWRLAHRGSRRDGWRLLAAMSVAVLALVPVYAGYAEIVRRDPALATHSLWARPEGPPGDGASPATWFWVYAYVVGTWYRFPVPLIALATIAGGFVARRRTVVATPRAAWMHGALWALLAFLLPAVRQWSPYLRGLHRAGLLDLVALAILAGLGFAACRAALAARVGPRPAMLAGVAGIVALATMPNGSPSLALMDAIGTYPTQRAPASSSPVIDALRATDGAVVEVPAGRPASDAEAVYRAIFHRRRLVNGYGSYYPPSLPARLARIRQLPSRLAVGLLHVETGVTTIVVNEPALDAASRSAWAPVLADPSRRTDLRLVVRSDDVSVFAVVRGSNVPAAAAPAPTAPPAAAPATAPGPSVSTSASDRSDGTLP